MAYYFQVDYQGAPFELYGTAHLIALSIITLACFSLLYFRRVRMEHEDKSPRSV